MFAGEWLILWAGEGNENAMRGSNRSGIHFRFGLLFAVLLAAEIHALPASESFSRQTGLPCSSCHTTPPTLTPLGRAFKLNGYTLSGLTTAQTLKPVQLPPPQTSGGRPLMQVLKDRKSSRKFSPDTLSARTLSDLLWAAFGINGPDGHRTAPSAMNWQEVSIYVVTSEGVYIYDAKDNTLDPLLAGDFRATTGTQSFVKDAAVNLVYVSDLSKTNRASSSDAEMFTSADVGFISQNVYLYCASEGLATVVRGSVNRAALAKTLKLRPNQKIILSQSVGFPKK
jgi:SagB-type dehydrogenase family enzyme